MYEANAIDVVIPSFRLDEEILLNIFHSEQPADFHVHYYIVADNPGLEVPLAIRSLADRGSINLVVNEKNLGFSGTRNKGIRLGSSKWVLLLDDDIVPEPRFLIAYAKVISANPDALGFAGVTNFPEPFNEATLAMELHGMTGHFRSAKEYQELMWIPTANVMLNRSKMDDQLFNEELKKGGEDIEFLVRNAKRYKEKYIGVPDALVVHPWWNQGRIQTERVYRYGAGAAKIAEMPAINRYTYHDFTNTSESLLLLLFSAPLIIGYHSAQLFFTLCLIILTAELLTTLARSYYLSGKLSFQLAAYLFWLKNCYEVGYLTESLSSGRLMGFAERIDMSFHKERPGWFRLNKWKIVKTVLILIGLSLALIF